MEAQIAQLRRSSATLSAIQDQARAGCSGTVELAEGLQQQIHETVDAFGTQGECLRVLGTAVEMLRELSPGAPPADPVRVEQMTSIYTMQSERGVHEALYETVPRNQSSPQEDNVEFF